MKSLLEVHEEHFREATAAVDQVEGEHQRRDAMTRLHRQHWEAMGVDYDEVVEYVEAMYPSFMEEVEEVGRVAGTSVAVPTAWRGAVATIAAVVAQAISGVELPADLEEIYVEDPVQGIYRGGYICDHGMVTVLGVDALGLVAFLRDGELADGSQRVDPEAFVAHFRRIDDVPVLGGEG